MSRTLSHGTGTPGWLTEPSDLVQQVADELGIMDIRYPEALVNARQTGFVWTRQPGLVCLAMNRQYFARARDNDCVSVIIAPPATTSREVAPGKTVITCSRAEELYLYLHSAQQPDPVIDTLDIHRSAVIDASVMLRGRVRIEADVHVGPRVVISGPATIRRKTHIEAGAIIGCEGLYAKKILGERQHIQHFGGVYVGESVFIHAGAIVVRSAIRGENTQIGATANIGIMADVGHDSVIGEGAILSSHCVIAGRAHIGKYAWIGASATVSNAIRIGDEARVRLGAVVIRDVPAGGDVSGNFAGDHTHTMRRYLKETASET